MSKRTRKKPPPPPGPQGAGQAKARAPRRTRGARSRRPAWVNLLVVAVAIGAIYLVGVSLSPSIPDIPDPDTDSMTPPVARSFREARRAVVAEPQSGQAWGHYGAVCDAHERFEDAAYCYEIARELDPRDFRWVYFLAVTRDYLGAPEEVVVPLFESAAAMRPDYPALQYRYGDALVRLGMQAEATAAYRRVTELRPNLAIGHFGLGQSLLAQGENEDAVFHLERAVEMEPKDGAAMAALARGYSVLGQDEKAEETGELARDLQAVRALPDAARLEVVKLAMDPDSVVARAQTYMSRSDFANAISELELFLEMSPDHAVVHYLLGACFAGTNQVQPAIEEFSTALRLKPDLSDADFEWGNLLARRRQFDEALEHYLRALEHEPENADIHAKVGLVYEIQREAPASLRAYGQAAKFAPANPAYNVKFGKALMGAGDLTGAERHFRAALDVRPDDPNTLLQYGLVLERLGRIDEAQEQFVRAVELDPMHVAKRYLDRSRDREAGDHRVRRRR